MGEDSSLSFMLDLDEELFNQIFKRAFAHKKLRKESIKSQLHSQKRVICRQVVVFLRVLVVCVGFFFFILHSD